MRNQKQEHLLDKGVEVLAHLSNKHHEKAGQERGHLHSGLQTVLSKNREEPQPMAKEE